MPAKRMTVKPNIIPFTNREAGAGFTRPMRQTPGASPPDLEHRPVGTNMPRITMTVKPNIIPLGKGLGVRLFASFATASAKERCAISKPVPASLTRSCPRSFLPSRCSGRQDDTKNLKLSGGRSHCSLRQDDTDCRAHRTGTIVRTTGCPLPVGRFRRRGRLGLR